MKVSLILSLWEETLATDRKFCHIFHSPALFCTICTCERLLENPVGERGKDCIIKHPNYSSVILFFLNLSHGFWRRKWASGLNMNSLSTYRLEVLISIVTNVYVVLSHYFTFLFHLYHQIISTNHPIFNSYTTICSAERIYK